MPKWTKEQQEAIRARNHTILVSAAAGSGKTAVLIERIVQLVKEGFSLDRMLIITFTRAAAGEMRQRLNQRLLLEAKDDPQTFSKSLDELESTDISTIDAFCQRVLRTDFQAVGVDAMARVCEEQVRESLFAEAYRQAMNELLEKVEQQDPDEEVRCFERLCRSFSQQALLDMATELYPFMMSMPDPFQWMKERISEVDLPLKEHPWYKLMLDQVRLSLEGLRVIVDSMADLLNDEHSIPALAKTVEADRKTVHQLLMRCEDNQQMIEALSTTSFVRAETTRNTTEQQKEWKKVFDEHRKQLKKLVKDSADRLLLDENNVNNDLSVVKTNLQGLLLLLKRLHAHFRALKNEQNVVDFNDLEQMTLEVLRNESCREQWQQRYDHIFVDECQDVSAVQDAMIQAIHGEQSCLFMVGDVKQSIYRFRLADPTLFLHRMRTFPDAPEASERRIFLQKNFRSRTNVLDATNRVFRKTMQRRVTELDYLPEDELVPGRDTTDDPPVEIHLVQKQEQSGDASLIAEANVVVKRIRQLLQTTFEDQGGVRTYQYRDMVILLQKKAGMGARLAELLQERGIPVYFDGSENYYGLPEIRTMKALLTVIDNPMQDIPLLTTLKMLPFSLTDGELADIRRAKLGRDVPMHEAFDACCEGDDALADKCRLIRAQLVEWRFMQETMRLSDFLWYLLRETGMFAACGAYPEGELRQANLRLLCQKAADYESRQNGGLSGFLRMIDLEMQTSDATAAKTLGENENLVRIMTMHKSKGLEFPVVFLMRMTSGMAGKSKHSVRKHARMGVCLPYVNPEMNITRDTLGDTVLKELVQSEEKAERCRLLYVAMTRARERLIMTGCAASGEPEWFMAPSSYRVSRANSMMDWVMAAICDDCGLHDPGNVSTNQPPWQVIVEENEQDQPETVMTEAQHDAWLKELLEDAPDPASLSWWYTEKTSSAMQPIKTSVTSLARQQILQDPMPLSDEDEEPEDKRASETIVAPLRMSELPSRPAFMEEKKQTGAERGSRMHRFLSMTDLARLKELQGAALTQAIRDEINVLTERQCFLPGQFMERDIRELAAFYASDLGRRVLASNLVKREWSFNLRLNKKDSTLLQGVIDCAFMEQDGWILVDYKTDHFDDNAVFIQRHQFQLSWYAAALERITGVKVREIWLYSISYGRSYPVEAVPVNG